MRDTLPDRVRLGAFQVDLRAGELRQGERTTYLQEQPLFVLRMLVERAGELVTRDEIKQKLWPNDTVVDFDLGINAAVRRLRLALGDSADQPRYLETIARRGYRLLVAVEALPSVKDIPPGEGANQEAPEGQPYQSSDASSTNLIGKKVSHYRALEVIGGGGMGMVHKAEDLKLGRLVALKFLPEELATDPAALQRFGREAQTASSLNHPNICTIYEVEEQDRQPFIVMELLQGETLRDRLANSKDGKLGLDELLDIASQICEGLQAAHRQSVLHRDIKPANIFLTASGRAKILDFGVAKLMQSGEALAPSAAGEEQFLAAGTSSTGRTDLTRSHLTRTGLALGTTGYMSPEQVRGEELDARSDIFSFGLVMYEMATGQRAFTGETAAVVHDAILTQTPIPIHDLNPKLPPKLGQLISRALEKDREQRYQTAAQLGTDLPGLRQPASGRSWASRWMLIGVAAAILCASAFVVIRSGLRKPEPTKEIVQRQLTANASDNPVLGVAAISRDGRSVAYTDKNGISIQNIENAEIHTLPGTVGLAVADWFPDSLHLLVADGKHELWALFMVSGEKHKLASPALDPTLSPDGSQIAFVREQLRRELWTMPAAGGDPQLRFAVGENESILAFAWSPDGKSVAYTRASRKVGGNPPTLETRNLEEGRPRVLLTEPNRPLNNLAWLADGRIVFERRASIKSFDSDLWTISSDPQSVGQPIRLTNTTGISVSSLRASSDGKRLSIRFTRSPYSIFIADLNKSGDRLESPYRLSNDSWNNIPYAWAPDSETLIYGSRRENLSGIYRRRLSSESAELLLPGTDADYVCGLSRDGKWALVNYNCLAPAKWRVLRVPLSGGAPETVLIPRGYASVRCAIAGSGICVLSEDIDKKKVFSVVDPVRGKLQELARVDAGGIAWNLSPDGSKIALVENLADSVRVLDLQSKQVQVIHPVPSQPGLQRPAWSADGKRLFVSGFPDDEGRLVEMDLEGHAHLLVENPNAWIGDPVPSPDGKRIAYIVMFRESNVTLLEHF
jgi:eukaryotic-like serine/threonine-protein kinase